MSSDLCPAYGSRCGESGCLVALEVDSMALQCRLLITSLLLCTPRSATMYTTLYRPAPFFGVLGVVSAITFTCMLGISDLRVLYHMTILLLPVIPFTSYCIYLFRLWCCLWHGQVWCWHHGIGRSVRVRIMVDRTHLDNGGIALLTNHDRASCALSW